MPDMSPSEKSNERIAEPSASLNRKVERVVPPAGSTRRPWPWQIFAAIASAFVAAFLVRLAFPPALATTSPTLLYIGETCTIAFQATNNADSPVSASILVTAGLRGRGNKISMSRPYVELASTTLAVTLAAREVRNLTWDFPLATGPHPNISQIEIVSYTQRRR